MKAFQSRRVQVAIGGGVVLVAAVALIAYDLNLLQAGIESPAPSLRSAAEAAMQPIGAGAGAYPPIEDYPSFTVTAPDGLALTVYAREPEGATANLLLIHGAGGGAWVWEAFFAALGPDYNLYAPSWRGHFDSAPVDDANRDDHTADMQAVLAAIAARSGHPTHLVGHSWGGTLAVTTALAAPDAVESLVLLAPVMPLSYTPIQSVVMPALVRPIVRRVLESGSIGSTFKGAFVAESQMQSYLGRHATQPYSVEKPGLLADDAFLPARQAQLAEDYRALAALKLPASIALARYDNVIPPPLTRRWADELGITAAQFDSGHYLQLDYLYPEVAAWLAAQLAE